MQQLTVIVGVFIVTCVIVISKTSELSNETAQQGQSALLVANDKFGKMQNGSSNQKELLGVALMHRHGVRTPFKPFPTLLPSSVKEANLSHLTPVGEAQAETLGKCIKDEYEEVIKVGHVTAFSSHVARCRQTAQHFYAAMFPDQINATQVRVLKQNFDGLYQEMIRKNLEAMRTVPFETPFGHQMDDFVKFLAKEVNSPYPLDDFQANYQVIDGVEVAVRNNWITPEVKKVLPYLHLMHKADFKFLPILIDGFEFPLGGEIVQHMLTFFRNLEKSGKNAESRFLTFSVSDISIFAAMRLLEKPMNNWPDFAETVAFEVYEDNGIKKVHIVQYEVPAKDICAKKDGEINRNSDKASYNLTDLIQLCEAELLKVSNNSASA